MAIRWKPIKYTLYQLSTFAVYYIFTVGDFSKRKLLYMSATFVMFHSWMVCKMFLGDLRWLVEMAQEKTWQISTNWSQTSQFCKY